MRVDTRQSLHFGVNFVFAPGPLLDGTHLRAFEGALADAGIEFVQRNAPGDRFQAVRNAPPLQVVLQPVDGPPGVAQLIVMSPSPTQTRSHFEQDARSVVDACDKVWPGHRQVLKKDCTVRYLFASKGELAFRYLWAERLERPETELDLFGRPILGGGLRFVIPPVMTGPESKPMIEIKVESFLQDTRRLFIDVQFVWGNVANAGFDVEAMLTEVDEFANEQVVNFILGKK